MRLALGAHSPQMISFENLFLPNTCLLNTRFVDARKVNVRLSFFLTTLQFSLFLGMMPEFTYIRKRQKEMIC